MDRQISKIRVEFPPSLGTLKEGVTRDFELTEKLGGGRILLRNLDDPSKYLSAEFAGIGVDELTRNKKSVFDFLRSRLRWPGVSRPRFVGGTNPSGIGHSWVKQFWIEREFPPELSRLADEFAFVPAKSSDNPYLDQSYHDDLETLPPDMAKAYAEGSWDIFAGQYFDKPIAKSVEKPESWDIKPWWPKWVSIDWGFEHPAAIYWHTLDEKNRFLTYREFVTRTPRNPERLGPRDLATKIADLSKEEEIGQIYLSPDAYAKRTDELTIAEQMGDVFVSRKLPRPIPADNDRVSGWMLMYQMLDAGEWKIGVNCVELIKCLPTLVRDELKPEDVEKKDGDDPADSARYGIKSRHRQGKVPLPERVNRRIETVQQARVEVGLPRQSDPTALAMMARIAVDKEKSKDKPVPLINSRRRRGFRP